MVDVLFSNTNTYCINVKTFFFKLPIPNRIINVLVFTLGTMVLMLSFSIPIHLIGLWDTGFFEPIT